MIAAEETIKYGNGPTYKLLFCKFKSYLNIRVLNAHISYDNLQNSAPRLQSKPPNYYARIHGKAYSTPSS